MRRPLALSTAVALGVLGCTEARDTLPTNPDLTYGSTACDFSRVRGYAKSLFGLGSTGEALAKAMAYKPAGSVAATSLGMDIFAEIARKRRHVTFSEGQISTAAKLTVAVIKCGTFALSGDGSVAAFAAALGPNGGYEVRGGSSSTGQADPTTEVRTLDNTSSAVLPPPTGFVAWLSGRALFYGRPINIFSGELAGGAAGLSGTTAFDWSTVRPGAHPPALAGLGAVALCVAFDDVAVPFEKLRVQKQTSILPIDDFDLCGGTSFARVDPPPRGLAGLPLGERLVRLTTSLLVPSPLYAAAAQRTGSPTGNAGSFSPFQVVNPVSIEMAYASAPKDGKKGEPLPGTALPYVAVRVAGAGGTGWQGVTVRIDGHTNNGTPTQVLNNVAITDATGLAIFPQLLVTKTGAIRLVATTVAGDEDVEGFEPSQVEAKKINIRP